MVSCSVPQCRQRQLAVMQHVRMFCATMPSGCAAGFGFRRSVATVPSGFAAGHLLQHHPVPGTPGKAQPLRAFRPRRSRSVIPAVPHQAQPLRAFRPRRSRSVIPAVPHQAQPLRAFRPPSISHSAQRLCRWVWLCSLSAQHAVSLVHGLHVCTLLRLLHNLW